MSVYFSVWHVWSFVALDISIVFQNSVTSLNVYYQYDFVPPIYAHVLSTFIVAFKELILFLKRFDFFIHFTIQMQVATTGTY